MRHCWIIEVKYKDPLRLRWRGFWVGGAIRVYRTRKEAAAHVRLARLRYDLVRLTKFIPEVR